MANKVICMAAVILMVVEIKALVFLIWSFCDAKREQEKRL